MAVTSHLIDMIPSMYHEPNQLIITLIEGTIILNLIVIQRHNMLSHYGYTCTYDNVDNKQQAET